MSQLLQNFAAGTSAPPPPANLWTDPPSNLGQWVDDGGGQYSFVEEGVSIGVFMRTFPTNIEVGKTYRYEFTVTDFITGNCRVRIGNASGLNRIANGTYTEDLVAVNTDPVSVSCANAFRGTVSNISAVELP